MAGLISASRTRRAASARSARSAGSSRLSGVVPAGAGPGVTAVRLASADPAPSGAGDIAEAARAVLDAEISPAIAAHRGRVRLAGVTGGWIRVRLEGGCQGCSLAEVTLRQGIEPLLRARLPQMTGLVDVTDHEAGTEPFFSPEKR